VSGARLEGDIVTVSGVGELVAGHGQFLLDNPGGDAEAAIEEAWLEVGDEHWPVTPASVFDTTTDEAYDPRRFRVTAGTTSFLVGFPEIGRPAGPARPIALAVRLRVGSETLEARSPIVFQQRRPL
jgi:hypothetical protein